MPRALSLLERQQADFVAYVERQRADGAALMRQLLDIFAEAAPSMPKAVEALTALPVPGSADAGNKPAAQKPAVPPITTKPVTARDDAPADPAADNVARERPKQRRRF